MGNKGISITKGECTRISVMSTAIYPFFKTNNYKIWTIKDLNLKLKRQKERENKMKFLQTVFFVFSLLSLSYFSFTFYNVYSHLWGRKFLHFESRFKLNSSPRKNNNKSSPSHRYWTMSFTPRRSSPIPMLMHLSRDENASLLSLSCLVCHQHW